MSQKRRFTAVTVVLAAMLLTVLTVMLMVGSAFGTGILGIPWSRVAGGGDTFSTGGSFSLGGTIGQHDAGQSNGGQFTLCGGFWGPDVPQVTATSTPTMLPTQTPGGPSATPVPTHIPTHIPTSTPARTHTPIHMPTQTPTRLSTQTPGGPTATSEPSDTATIAAVSSATPTVCTLQFTDVPANSTFYSYIRCMACRGIVNGYTTGCTSGSPCFRPNNNVTRGQLSKIVSNSAGFQDPPSAQLFQDVPPGSAFYDHSFRLASRGIISGYACGGTGEPCIGPGNLPYFRLSSNATRGQISKVVSNAAGYIDTPVGQTFQDVSPGSTFYTFTQRLTSRSIMQGYACGVAGAGEPCVPPDSRPYFRPNNNATRGQTSKIVANTFFPDCRTPEER